MDSQSEDRNMCVQISQSQNTEVKLSLVSAQLTSVRFCLFLFNRNEEELRTISHVRSADAIVLKIERPT